MEREKLTLGTYVIPGAVDGTWASQMPFADISTADSFEQALLPQLWWCYSVYDFVEPEKGQDLVEALDGVGNRPDGHGVIDYGLPMTSRP